MENTEELFENDEFYDKLSDAEDENTIQEILAEFDVYNENSELDESTLEAVTGGASRSWTSAKIVAVTYYEMKKYGRAKTYSKEEISEAVNWVERNAKLYNTSVKMAVKEVRVGLKISHALGLV